MSGKAVLKLFMIIFFDLKYGPIIWNIFLDKYDDFLTPKILKIVKKKMMIKNSKEYLINLIIFIYKF